MKKKAIIVSKDFNPIHKGYLEYFKSVKATVGGFFVVNNDLQSSLKCSKDYQKENEQISIVQNIKALEKKIIRIDKKRTVFDSMKYINKKIFKEYCLGFENSGSQNINSIPEVHVCKELEIQLNNGLCNKIDSTSCLLKK